MKIRDFFYTKNNNLIPLYVILVYLIFTLVLFKFGPIGYFIHNELAFWLYMFYYLVAVSLGYAFGVNSYKFYGAIRRERLIRIPFFLFSFVAFCAALILNANLAKQESVYPDNLVKLLSGQIGLLDMGAAYYQRIETGSDFEGSLVRNVFFTMTGWVRFVFVIYIITFWPRLNVLKRLIGFLIILIPILSGISIGTNRSVFEPAILIFLTAIHGLVISRAFNDSIAYFWNKKILKIGSVFLVVAIVFFGVAMSGRGADTSYIESTSKAGDITIKASANDLNGFESTGYMLIHYLVQGYYGFSLSLNEDFDSTYGFGHSPFLLRQIERFAGEDFGKSTYQSKIDDIWAESRQWHSAYAQFANDVHFIGVGVILFFVSYLYSIAFCLAKKYRYREAIYLLPLLSLFFIFLPANNQVFGYVETLFAFLILSTAMHLRLSFRYRLR